MIVFFFVLKWVCEWWYCELGGLCSLLSLCLTICNHLLSANMRVCMHSAERGGRAEVCPVLTAAVAAAGCVKSPGRYG